MQYRLKNTSSLTSPEGYNIGLENVYKKDIEVWPKIHPDGILTLKVIQCV